MWAETSVGMRVGKAQVRATAVVPSTSLSIEHSENGLPLRVNARNNDKSVHKYNQMQNI